MKLEVLNAGLDSFSKKPSLTVVENLIKNFWEKSFSILSLFCVQKKLVLLSYIYHIIYNV